MKKISIVTLGCKVNQVESEQVAELLEQDGYDVTMGMTPADIYIINTCAVTNEAERKSRNMMSKVLKLNPTASIYICGCSSQNNAEQFKKGEYVKGVIGNINKKQLVEMIEKNDPDFVSNVKCVFETRVSPRTRAVLWVQNGCNNFCTYCLIPYLRGREVSFPLDEVRQEVRKLEKQANEIVVTGINLSSYGKDVVGSDGLIEIARLFKNSNARFRFSSLEVNVIDDKFLSELVTFDNFCDHFHLSLQSGSNNTLKSMNRHYTKEQYLEKVNLIRKYFPNAGITTDIIIGFPTETNDDFFESLEFAKQANFSEMHIFPYSKRNGTVAEKFKNIATDVSDRVAKMTRVAEEMKNAFLIQNKNKTHQVVIENEKNGYYLAHTKNFILCYIKSDKPLAPNSVINVKIGKPYEDGVLAKLV